MLKSGVIIIILLSTFCVKATKDIYINPIKLVVFLNEKNAVKYGDFIEFTNFKSASLALLNIKHKSENSPIKSLVYYFESGEKLKFTFFNDDKVDILITYKRRKIKAKQLVLFKFDIDQVYLFYLFQQNIIKKVKPMFKSKYFYIGFQKTDNEFLGVNSLLFQKRKFKGIGILPE